MSANAHPRIVKWPSEGEITIAFEAYALALGKVAFAWNFLHERLGRVFIAVCQHKPNTSLEIWYSTESDRVKQHMLKAAIAATSEWPDFLPDRTKEDLLWLANTVMKLGDARNDAVHAPCILNTDADGTKMIAAPEFFSRHGRAKKLRGKKLLVEFDFLERWMEELSRFSEKTASALLSERAPWPDRPSQPPRKPNKKIDLTAPPRTI